MPHEKSETEQRDGGWVNVYGRSTPQAGMPLPPEYAFELDQYPTVDAAVSAAKNRSQAEGHKPAQRALPAPDSGLDRLAASAFPANRIPPAVGTDPWLGDMFARAGLAGLRTVQSVVGSKGDSPRHVQFYTALTARFPDVAPKDIDWIVQHNPGLSYDDIAAGIAAHLQQLRTRRSPTR